MTARQTYDVFLWIIAGPTVVVLVAHIHNTGAGPEFFDGMGWGLLVAGIAYVLRVLDPTRRQK